MKFTELIKGEIYIGTSTFKWIFQFDYYKKDEEHLNYSVWSGYSAVFEDDYVSKEHGDIIFKKENDIRKATDEEIERFRILLLKRDLVLELNNYAYEIY